MEYVSSYHAPNKNFKELWLRYLKDSLSLFCVCLLLALKCATSPNTPEKLHLVVVLLTVVIVVCFEKA